MNITVQVLNEKKYGYGSVWNILVYAFRTDRSKIL